MLNWVEHEKKLNNLGAWTWVAYIFVLSFW